MASELVVIIESGNGLSPVQCQAITWTNDGLLLIGLLETNFSENLNKNMTNFMKANQFENLICKTMGNFFSLNMCSLIVPWDKCELQIICMVLIKDISIAN